MDVWRHDSQHRLMDPAHDRYVGILMFNPSKYVVVLFHGYFIFTNLDSIIKCMVHILYVYGSTKSLI